MSVVDASVWVSLLAADDDDHEDTRRWFDQQLEADSEFVAPTLVLVEVAGAMSRRTGDPTAGVAAAARVQILPELELVDLTVEAAEQAGAIAARIALRGADAVYAAFAATRGLRLITWDRQQRERSAAVVRTVTPADDLDQQ